MIWEYWLYGLVALFLTVTVFFTTTPFINELTDSSDAVADFSDAATNTSFNNLIEHTSNMWNLWPVAAGALILLIIFYFASEENEYERRY